MYVSKFFILELIILTYKMSLEYPPIAIAAANTWIKDL